jgi:hypothetical protein
MRTLTKLLTGAAGVATIAVAAAPASAQVYGSPYGYGYTSPYGYGSPYGYTSPYGYGYNNYGTGNVVGQIINSVIGNNAYAYSADTQANLDRCAAVVEQRINASYSPYGYGGTYGYNQGYSTGRVVGIHSIERISNGLRIKGVASDGRTAAYGYAPYNNYGAAAAPNLRFKCDIDYRGYVMDIDLGANTSYTYNWTPYQRRYY